jgi:thiamine kinase-like enzyme
VAPEVVAFFEEAGVLVTRFVAGRAPTEQDARRPEMLARMAAVVRRYHEGRAFPGVFSPFAAVRDALAVCAPRGAPLPERLPWMLAGADRLEAVLGLPAGRCPCHNDLLLANWIDDGRRLWIIDWEYAAAGDPFFDLANLAAHLQLADEEEAVLLQAYFGRVSPQAAARLKLMKIASDLREALWAMVQVTISTLDYDFAGYGQRHFDRCAAQLEDPRLAEWLAVVAGQARPTT